MERSLTDCSRTEAVTAVLLCILWSMADCIALITVTFRGITHIYLNILVQKCLQDLKPKDIVTRASFENAMVLVMALGGSTNAVLHLIAMAKAFDIELNIDDFQSVSPFTIGAYRPFSSSTQGSRAGGGFVLGALVNSV